MTDTARLKVIQLSYEQLLTYLQANNRLEIELGLAETNRVIAPDVKEMVENFTLPRIKEMLPDQVVFYTFWLAIEKASRIIVAELGFKGIPDNNGTVEIGYGTMPEQQGRGFMTEAVGVLLEWAGQRNDINTVLASVQKTNIASIRIAEKNNFELFEQIDEMLWFRKDVSAK